MRTHSLITSSTIALCLAAIGMLGAGAPANAALVTSTAPTGLGASSVTLNGTVDPEGVATSECWFEYVRASKHEYTSAEPCTPSPGSSAGPVAVSAHISELAVDTPYHYRIALSNENGTYFSEDQLFVTAPLIEGAAQASNITSYAATLTGVIQTGEAPPFFHFDYGTTSAYGSTAPAPDAPAGIGAEQTVTQTLTGLAPNTTYHYALATTNFGGASTTGPDETFTTRPLAPPAVNAGPALNTTQTASEITGTINPEGLQSTYQIQYATTTSYGSQWPSIQTPIGNSNTLQAIAIDLENLQPATTYHYRITATNEDGTTYTPDQTLTTPAYPPSTIQTPPATPTPTTTTHNTTTHHTTHHTKKTRKKKTKRKTNKHKKHK